jgi:hypothetical protein
LVPAGGLPQPGPIFQALPEPLPLPALPEPFAAEAPSMAPDSAPAGLPGPGANLQVQRHVNLPYSGIARRRLQQDPLADGPPGTIPEATQPLAAYATAPAMSAEAPDTAPGALLSFCPCLAHHRQSMQILSCLHVKVHVTSVDEVNSMLRLCNILSAGGLPLPGPGQLLFQELPQPAPLLPLPEPFAAEAPVTAPSGLPGPGANLQAQRHLKNPYQGIARRLQQDPLADGPPGTIPEATQPFAAEAPLTAPGALPQNLHSLLEPPLTQGR